LQTLVCVAYRLTDMQSCACLAAVIPLPLSIAVLEGMVCTFGTKAPSPTPAADSHPVPRSLALAAGNPSFRPPLALIGVNHIGKGRQLGVLWAVLGATHQCVSAIREQAGPNNLAASSLKP